MKQNNDFFVLSKKLVILTNFGLKLHDFSLEDQNIKLAFYFRFHDGNGYTLFDRLQEMFIKMLYK